MLFLSNKTFAQAITLELIPAYYDIYNISYFGAQDGYIDLNVTGGIPPYNYRWSNAETSEDIWELAAGYYHVTVWDNFGNQATAEITLTEPKSDAAPMAPCTVTGTPGWSGYNTPPLLWTCPWINVEIGSYSIPPSGMKFSVYGNSYLNGTVYIGINPTNVSLTNGSTPYKLLVGGKIGAREVIVSSLTPWPDYVFAKGYKVKSLNEISNYISLNKHLPDMPSSIDIEANGQSLGEIQKMQQQKIEELFLYVIQLQKRITELENE